MKSNFKLFFPFAVVGALVWVGCQTQVPTTYSNLVSSTSMVINFESGLGVNPNLSEANTPNYKVEGPGTAVVSFTAPATSISGGVTTIINYGSGTFSVTSPGAAATNHCIHVTGTVIDHGDGKYPGGNLEIPIEGLNNYYDGSFFTGVKFYLNVPGDDTANTKTFQIPVAQTQPPSAGGDCNSGISSNACYNNFSYSYSNTSGNWQLVTLPFSAMTRASYGAAISPTALSGINLQQILMLEWFEGNQNAGGTANVDFYVDEVQFY